MIHNKSGEKGTTANRSTGFLARAPHPDRQSDGRNGLVPVTGRPIRLHSSPSIAESLLCGYRGWIRVAPGRWNPCPSGQCRARQSEERNMAAKPNYETGPGNGGETHQRLPADGPHDGADHLTTNQGIHVSDNQNSLKSGLRGPTLLEDFVLREKIFHFDHERIPERVVHARGSGAHGYFECYKPLTELTKASLFAEEGKITPVLVRFS